MATILVNGCFDLLHPGHARFLICARYLGGMRKPNRLIAAINSDASAKRLKGDKWGEKYPILDQAQRAAKLARYVDEVHIFDTEDELYQMILRWRPLVICKGPDYIGKKVTGDNVVPVVILNTFETDAIREIKRKAYAR